MQAKNRTLSKVCGKGHNNWSTWTSRYGKVFTFFRRCQDKRGEKYAQLKKNAKGHHTKKEWELKKKEYKVCSGCKRPWKEIRENPSIGKAKYTITKDHIIPLSKEAVMVLIISNHFAINVILRRDTRIQNSTKTANFTIL